MRRRLICFLLGVLMMMSVFTGCEKADNPIATIEIEDYGTITVELYPDVAPESVANFITLANSGFYDGLTFHRVIEGFMIQGGDPKGDGTGGPGYTIKGEFANNKFSNNVTHAAGVISMARSGYNNSGGSQFFICVDDVDYLDGSYAAFGKTISGLDIAVKISKLTTDSDDKPEKDVVIKQIRVDTKGVEYTDFTKIPSYELDRYKDAQTPIATIEVKDYGTIELELYPDIAPDTVANFVTLANAGFYDGLIFHRVIDGFMIQGGDPEGKGTGGPGYNIVGEFSSNGFSNTISHVTGVISMARSQAYDSAGSQFFICVGNATYLDGSYAAFGKVTSGLDVALSVGETHTDYNDKPTTNVVISQIRVDTKGVDYSQFVKFEKE